jgi:protein-S-isoprenylcysteine O-methyltransferase Ste14
MLDPGLRRGVRFVLFLGENRQHGKFLLGETMQEKRRKLLEGIFNVVGAATYIVSCGFFIADFDATHRISNLFMLARRFIFAIFFITRKTPAKTNTSLRDWLVAVSGTWVQNFFLPAPEVHDIPLMHLVQGLGLAVCLGGALSLNESWGIVAANRGVKSRGLYKFVRHPIYAGYFLEAVSYVAQNITGRNLAVLAVWAALQLWRIRIEEDYLSADPAYRQYTKDVRWRLLPGIF